MAFDPDAYLSDSSTQFDPDAFLKGSIPVAQPGIPGQTIPSIEPKTLAGRATSVLSNPSLAIPGFPIVKPLVDTTKQVYKAEEASPTPFEDTLPAVGGVVGGIVGSPGVITGGVGAGLGASAGEAGRQIIRRVRGKDVPETSLEAGKEIAKEGAIAGATDILFAGAGKTVLKGIEKAFVSKLGKSSFGRFKGFIDDMVKPNQSTKATAKALKSVEDKPVSNLSDTQEIIENVFAKKKLTHKKGAEAIRSKMMQESNLTSQEVGQMAQDLADAKSPSVAPSLPTTDANPYKMMGRIMDALGDKNLSYGDLLDIQKTVGNIAKFGKSNRTPIEKMYGTIYRSTGKDLARTAEEQGFSKAHKIMKEEGRKFYQRKFLSDAFTRATDLGAERGLNMGKLESELSLAEYTESEIKSIFGDKSKMVEALRDVVAEHSKAFGSKASLNPYLTPSGVKFFGKPGNFMGKLNLQSNVKKIGAKHGVDIPLPILDKTRKIGIPIAGATGITQSNVSRRKKATVKD